MNSTIAPAPAARVEIASLTTARECREWGRLQALEGPAPTLPDSMPHSFRRAALEGIEEGTIERTGRDSAWLLGHAFGLSGITPRVPGGYGPDRAESFREGWQAGDAERRDTFEPTPEDLATLHEGDPGDPQGDAVRSMTTEEYYDACAELDDVQSEARAFVQQEWDARSARRSAGPITDADMLSVGAC